MNTIKLECQQVSREVWEEREYRFEKSPTMARSDFEAMARICVGWDEEIEMEIKFDYMLQDRVCYVFVRERVE